VRPFLRRRVALGPGEAWTLLGVGAAVLVDVRTAEAFATARVPGAVNLPLDGLDRAGELFDAAASLLVVDANGQLLRDVVRRLRSQGLHASEVSGGMTAWRLTGLPLEGTAHDSPAAGAGTDPRDADGR